MHVYIQVAGDEEPSRPADAPQLEGGQEGPQPMEALEDVVLQNSSQFHRQAAEGAAAHVVLPLQGYEMLPA